MVSSRKHRKSKGEGRMSLQRKERNRKAELIVKWVWPHMDTERVEMTGDLWPRGSLKKRRVRELFQPWIHRCKGRWFTLKTAKLACRKLHDQLPSPPNRNPALSFGQYIKVQAKRLLQLSRAAKESAMCDPTATDTLIDVDVHNLGFH